MTHRTSAPMKARKDIGEVVFPIEKLMAARAASSSWMGLSAHVVHLLIGDVDLLGADYQRHRVQPGLSRRWRRRGRGRVRLSGPRPIGSRFDVEA